MWGKYLKDLVKAESKLGRGGDAMRRVMTGAIVALVLVSVGAWAQTNGTSAFGQLPPGEQKIARALFEAQTGPTRLTPDQIAEMKGREGWGRVFKQMKERGLLTQKNLGQVVSNFERQHASTGRGRDEGASGGPASGNGMGRGTGHSGGKR
jgi:hypothetical protein